MKTVILTSDGHSWLLHGFLHQWEKCNGHGKDYDGDPLRLEVAGFTKPGWLPSNVPFYSIGDFADYPVEKWSDALITYLDKTPEELILVLLEDYWMIRPINRNAIYTAYSYMVDHPNTIRFDVASDRMFNRACGYHQSYGSIDICKGKGQYSLSFQASIFQRKLLLEMLVPGETPWQTELNGSGRLNLTNYDVVGSYQWPMNYAIVMNKGKLDTQGLWMYPPRTLCQDDWQELNQLGYLNREIDNEHAL